VIARDGRAGSELHDVGFSSLFILPFLHLDFTIVTLDPKPGDVAKMVSCRGGVA
jgi:hypothetical protein